MDFDAILDLEGSFLREGSDEGIRDGKKSGLSSGYRIGLVKGREVGWEIGCYVGLCRVIEKQCQESPDHPLSRKLEKHLQKFDDLVKRFPFDDPTRENLFTVLEQIRAKAKQICSLIGIAASDILGDHHSEFSSQDLRALSNSVLNF
eukprot:TRINITY_DN7508_c0_g1_i2.p1 TRINITY_DN7508_c0_g1~~TRINITY_DN7508_c0_g1_i2.p1  ORF type:complete len:147 (+),score=36.03 TRINITY_DN7508_c0_g1_i2:43-483(+)